MVKRNGLRVVRCGDHEHLFVVRPTQRPVEFEELIVIIFPDFDKRDTVHTRITIASLVISYHNHDADLVRLNKIFISHYRDWFA